MTRPLVVLALLGLATTARAADWVTPTLIYGGAQAGDYFSSVHARRRGGIEFGPVAAANLPAAKVIGAAALIGIDLELQKRGRTGKRFAWGLRVGVAVGYAIAIKSNHGKGRP